MDRGGGVSQGSYGRVRLDVYEVEQARLIARQRSEMNRENGAQPRYGAPKGEEGERINVRGVMGEMGVAKYLNLFYSGSVGNYKAIDVGYLVEVRAVDHMKKRLLVHHGDRDFVPFVSTCVPGNGSEIILRGWLYGAEAKSDAWWSDPAHENRYAFFAPNSALRPMAELEMMINGAVRV